MSDFTLEIFAADKIFYRGPCRSLSVPTVDGLYGILANHEDTIIAVAIGIAKFTDGDGVKREAVLSNGICKIEKNSVLILVETAEDPAAIDREHAERDAAEAREALSHHQNVSDTRRAQAKMLRAMNRLKAHDRTEID